jgi:protein-S-isoprenylcysteine O-methyltransferase Ste14
LERRDPWRQVRRHPPAGSRRSTGAEDVDNHRKSNLYAAAQTILIVVFAAVFFFAPGPALFAPAVAGYAVSVVGLAIIAAAFISLRNVIQVAPEPRADGHLVTSGIYRWLRHPM